MAEAEGKASLLRDADVGIYTETLARLYLKQGFVERALTMYRRLAQEQPHNDALHKRLRTLEHDLTLGLLASDPVTSEVVIHDTRKCTVMTMPHPGEQVVRRLERWLRHVQQQHQQHEAR